MNTTTNNTEQKKVTKGRMIGYWIVTALLIFELLYGALWDFNILNKDYVYRTLAHLGYPTYLAAVLAVAKILAAVIILLPGFRLGKEWAYAGVTILFAGALVSHMLTGDSFAQYCFTGVFLILTLSLWLLRYRDRLNNPL